MEPAAVFFILFIFSLSFRGLSRLPSYVSLCLLLLACVPFRASFAQRPPPPEINTQYVNNGVQLTNRTTSTIEVLVQFRSKQTGYTVSTWHQIFNPGRTQFLAVPSNTTARISSIWPGTYTGPAVTPYPSGTQQPKPETEGFPSRSIRFPTSPFAIGLLFLLFVVLCAMMVTIVNVARTRYIVKGGWLQVIKGYGPCLQSDEKFDLTHLVHAEIKRGLTEQLTNNATLVLNFAPGHGDKLILRGMARTKDVRMISDGLNNLSRLLRSNPALKGLVG